MVDIFRGERAKMKGKRIGCPLKTNLSPVTFNPCLLAGFTFFMVQL